MCMMRKEGMDGSRKLQALLYLHCASLSGRLDHIVWLGGMQIIRCVVSMFLEHYNTITYTFTSVPSLSSLNPFFQLAIL